MECGETERRVKEMEKGVGPIETGILDSLRSGDHPRDAAWVQ